MRQNFGEVEVQLLEVRLDLLDPNLVPCPTHRPTRSLMFLSLLRGRRVGGKRTPSLRQWRHSVDLRVVWNKVLGGLVRRVGPRRPRDRVTAPATTLVPEVRYPEDGGGDGDGSRVLSGRGVSSTT